MLPASEVLAVLRRNGLTAHGYQCVRSWPGDDHSYHPAGYDDLAEWQSRPDARRLGRVKIPDGAKRLRVRLQRGPGQPPPQTHSDRPCLAVLSEFGLTPRKPTGPKDVATKRAAMIQGAIRE